MRFSSRISRLCATFVVAALTACGPSVDDGGDDSPGGGNGDKLAFDAHDPKLQAFELSPILCAVARPGSVIHRKEGLFPAVRGEIWPP